MTLAVSGSWVEISEPFERVSSCERVLDLVAVHLYELHGVVQYGLIHDEAPFPSVGAALEPLSGSRCRSSLCIQGVFMNYMLVSQPALLLRLCQNT